MTLANKARGPAFPRTELPYPSADQGLDIKPSFLHSHPANDLTMASAREMQTQLARQKLVARQMRECIEALSQRAEDAEKRYDDLEDELNVAREEILLQQNDKHSLQTSLDLLMSENARSDGAARRKQRRDRTGARSDRARKGGAGRSKPHAQQPVGCSRGSERKAADRGQQAGCREARVSKIDGCAQCAASQTSD